MRMVFSKTMNQLIMISTWLFEKHAVDDILKTECRLGMQRKASQKP